MATVIEDNQPEGTIQADMGVMDSLWVDTPRGLLHIFINDDGSWKMTAWNTKGSRTKAPTITKNKKKGSTYYHLKQIVYE